MKISTNLSLGGNHGRRNFLRRLIRSLQKQFGIRLVDMRAKPDINLIFIQGRNIKGAKNVVRIDGIYYDRPRLKVNIPIRQSILNADGVIYQSDFSRQHVNAILDISVDNYRVIHNGYFLKEINKATTSNAFRGYDKVFVTCSHWRKRPSKRLEAIVDGFIQASQDKNWCLVVIGQTDNYKRLGHRKILNLGMQSPDQVISIYKASDYMVHISHIDSCPNAVVEALGCGVPVLCNNIGGTPEIVGSSGLILQIDRSPYNYKLVFNKESDIGSVIVNRDIVRDGFLKIAEKSKSEWTVNRPDLNIKNVAKKYYQYFLEILS